MSKVLVDLELLEEAAKWLEVHSPSPGSAEAFVAEALREAIVQPAEAEGVVPVVAWRRMEPMDNEFCDWEFYTNAEEATEPLVLQSDHLAALSAVTAERGALRVEVESMRKDAERYRWIRNPDQVVGHVIDKMVSSGVYEYRAGDELDDAIDDAMQQS